MGFHEKNPGAGSTGASETVPGGNEAEVTQSPTENQQGTLFHDETEKLISGPGREEDFDWSPRNRDIICPDQQAVAIFLNHWGQVVFRQERSWDEEDDVWVRINFDCLPKVIERLQDLLRLRGED
jgi:hypothetical protein